MAIDTAAKRNSALLDPWGVLPFPDGTIDSGDRLTLLGFYSGIGAEEPETPTGPRPGAYRGYAAAAAPHGAGRAPAPRGRGQGTAPKGYGRRY
jgi:hypothetical protein